MPEPGWVAHAIWWHVYPLGFAGADTTGVDRGDSGGLRRLTHWLDYAVELGVNGIQLGPIFRSATHGYDTLDHFAVDERLGTDEDFERLVEAARGRGLRLMLDGVFNHVGRDFPQTSWFRRGPDGIAVFEGHEGLVALDHEDPAVADHVVAVMDHWLDRGADAWRLDAAYAVPRTFWSRVLPRVRTAHPDAYVVGEVIHGDCPAIVRETGMDSVTQYELWKAIWSSLCDRNLFELAAALERHDGFLRSFVPQTFVGNHDVTRLATRLGDHRLVALALVVLFTVGGTPSVYAGDEQAFEAVKEERVGGDDAIRPEFPASPSGLAPWGRDLFALHQELIGLRRRHPWLHGARTEVIELANEHVLTRSSAGADSLYVALNLGEGRHRVVINGPRPGAVLAGAAGAWIRDRELEVPARGWAVVGETSTTDPDR